MTQTQKFILSHLLLTLLHDYDVRLNYWQCSYSGELCTSVSKVQSPTLHVFLLFPTPFDLILFQLLLSVGESLVLLDTFLLYLG